MHSQSGTSRPLVIHLPYFPTSSVDRDVEPRTAPIEPNDPLGFGADHLRRLEMELESTTGLPSPAALCKAADVLIVEGRVKDAVAILFWGTLKYPVEGSESNRLLMQRLGNALQCAGSPAESLDLLGRQVSCNTKFLAAALMASADQDGGEACFAQVARGSTRSAADMNQGELALYAVAANLQGKHEESARAMERMQDKATRFDSLMAMCRLNSAFGRPLVSTQARHAEQVFDMIESALADNDRDFLAHVWRSPLLRDLSSYPRFDSLVARSGVTQLRTGNCRLAVPPRMLYGGALTFWARRRLALARYLFLEMQGEWRVNGLLCTPASAITAASVFLVGGCPAEAVKQLESAIQKFPLVDGTPLLQPSLGKLLLSLGKTAEAKHVVVELRALKPDAYLGVLAAVHCDVTEEQGLERAIECLRAEKERIPATLSARGRADETAQIEAQIFVLQHQLGEIRGHDCGAQATMQGLYGLARVQALCAVGKKDDALSALNDLLLKGDSPSLTEAPNLAYLPDLTAYAGLFELKGSPAWEAFLVRSGLAEIASRDLWIRPDTAQAA